MSARLKSRSVHEGSKTVWYLRFITQVSVWVPSPSVTNVEVQKVLQMIIVRMKK